MSTAFLGKKLILLDITIYRHFSFQYKFVMTLKNWDLMVMMRN